MSKTRRLILFIFGLAQACFGWFAWSATSFIRGRTGTVKSYELAEEVLAMVEDGGGTFPEADDFAFAIAEPIRREIFAQADQPLLIIAVFGICGVVCMLLAVWPAKRTVASE